MLDDDISTSPEWFPLRFADQNRGIEMVRLEESAYESASFLDERLLAGNPDQVVCPMATVQSAASTLPHRCHYIFHTGHVGSTLISRLVGAGTQFFSLREPALLRSFAGERPSNVGPLTLDALLALLSRTWRPAQRPVIKLTSFLSERASDMLAAQAGAVAIFVFAQPLNFLRGIFAGQNSRAECAVLAAERLRRLQRRVAPHEWHADPRSEGEVIAMSWLCEMSALFDAASRHRSQILWMDFDAFLQDPIPALCAVLTKLGASPDVNNVEELVRGPLMRRYSKGPEFPYDTALRNELLTSAGREHAAEITRGLDWLARAAADHPPLQSLFG